MRARRHCCRSRERLERIRVECEAFDAGERSDFSFLSKSEQSQLAEILAREELQSMLENGVGCVASYCVTAGRVTLWFRAEIEDDGSCLFLEGPYERSRGPLATESDERFVREVW